MSAGWRRRPTRLTQTRPEQMQQGRREHRRTAEDADIRWRYPSALNYFGTNRSNLALWQELEGFAAQRAVEIEWIKGHAGDPYNEAVDKLAQQAAKAADEALQRRMKRAA